MQGLHLLLHQAGAQEQVADVAHHAGALWLVAQESAGVELALEMAEEVLDLAVRRRPRAPLGQRLRGRIAAGRLEPLVADQQHRLGEVERGVGGVDRHRHDGVGERHVVVVEAGALAPEQHARGLARGPPAAHVGRRLARLDDGLEHVARPRGGGEHVVQVGDRLGGGVEQPDGVEHRGRPGRGAHRLDVGPAVARPHQPEVGETEVEHRARRGADVLAELRPHQDDRGCAARVLAAAVVSGHRRTYAGAPSRKSL